MDRKSKTWIIVLAVLLIAAIVAIVTINGKWNAGKIELAETKTQLTETTTQLDETKTQLDETKTQLSDVNAKLETAEATAARVPQLEEDAKAANTRIEELETAATESATIITGYEEATKNADALIQELQTASEVSNALIGEYEAKVVAYDARIAELENQLAEAQAAVVTSAETAQGSQDNLAELTGETTGEGFDVSTLVGTTDGVAAAGVTETPAIEGLPDLDELSTRIDALIENGDNMTDEERTAAYAEVEEDLAEAAELLKTVSGGASIEQAGDALQEKLDEIEALNEQIDTLNEQSEAGSQELEQLQQQLDSATAEAAELAAQIESMQGDYEKQLDALEAYKLYRELTDGEAHTATTATNVIEITADGVTGAWQYENASISSNAVTISLQLNDEAIYTSASLQPGESLDSITLEKALEAGSYQATLVTTIYGEDGAEQFVNRMPVTLKVAAN